MTSQGKIFSALLLLTLGIQAMALASFWASWGFLELSSVTFLSLLSSDYTTKRQSEVLKFYLIQAFSGMSMLILLLLKTLFDLSCWTNLFILMVSLKMASVPFHVWFLNLSHSLSWENLYLFLTVQKIIPLFLISLFSSSLLFGLSALAWVIAPLGGMACKTLKKLFVFSSLAFTGLMLYSVGDQGPWFSYLFIYSVIGAPLFLNLKGAQESPSGTVFYQVRGSSVSLIWLTFLNLGGLPPLPGFFIKLVFLSSLVDSPGVLAVFLASSLLIMYMYMGVSLKLLLKSTEYEEASLGGMRSLTLLLFSQSVLSTLVLVLCVGVIT